MLALKAYIQAKDTVQYDGLPQDMILLDLTHSNLKQQHIEIRFYKSDSLDTLRQRIYQKTGTPHDAQHLQIISAGIMLHEIPPSFRSSTKLGYFSLEHGMRIHCMDVDPHSASRGGRFEDTSLVEKYRMSEEDYEARKGTLRDWQKQQQQKDATFTLRKHAKEHAALMEAKRQAKLGLELPKGFVYDENGAVQKVEEEEGAAAASSSHPDTSSSFPGPESIDGIEVGMRCQVEPGARRGQVAYAGLVPELKPGHWVGVVFDEPVGKTDGSVGGKRYFEAGQSCGGFVRGKNVAVGDYPERDLFDELSDSEDEL